MDNPNMSPTDQNTDYTNPNYIKGLKGENDNYDPGLVKEAIDQLISQMKEITANGGHVSEGMTMLLLALVQGFGGQQVGLDGAAQSALTEAQNDVSAAWQSLKDATANTTGQPTEGTNVFEGHINDAVNAIQRAEDKGLISKSQGDEIIASIKAPIGNFKDFGTWWTTEQNKPEYQSGAGAQLKDAINKILSGNPPDYLQAIAYLSQAHTYQVDGKDVSIQGNPQWLDTINSSMTTMNQQVTGASQVMATQAKIDAQTNQAETTAWNNFLEMLKNMNQYFTQQQAMSGA